MALSNLNSDRTASKIAFCSAVVAGVAYVGYSLVSNLTELTRRRKRRGHDDGRHRIFLRRLSQTTQTDALLGEIDMEGANKIILRPKSVQERIKELNIRANQFAEAVRAIQSNGSTRPHGVSARSLQATPWTSPRVLSPVDIRHIVPHRSPERDCLGEKSSPMNSPSRCPRWNRTSQKIKPTHNRKVEFNFQEDSRLRECDRIWTEEQDEILKQLPNLLGDGRELNVEEAQYLVASLNSEDEALITEILVTIANCAAFSVSQDSLREAGLLAKMPKILLNSNNELKEKVLTAVSNMALNEKNNQEMRVITSVLVHLILSTPASDESLVKNVLSTLTNVAVLPTWHKEMGSALHKIFNLLDEMQWKNDGISYQALRLLINLSCNEEMIPNLLAAQAPCKLIYMVDMSMPENVVLRITTLLANVATTAKKMHIDPTYDLPAEDKAAAPDTLYASIFGLSVVERLARKAQILSERHQHEDVRMQAKRLLIAIAD